MRGSLFQKFVEIMSKLGVGNPDGETILTSQAKLIIRFWLGGRGYHYEPSFFEGEMSIDSLLEKLFSERVPVEGSVAKKAVRA